MSATLGGLVKDYRQQKNLTQYEIAFALGWKEPSRLSRIEQGKVSNPPRELIDKIIRVLDLKEEEKNHLLLVGNYLPTKEEIAKMRKDIKPLLENWPYPAYVLDFSWRFIAWNKSAAKVYSIDVKTSEELKKNMPRSLDIVFDANFIQNRLLKKDSEKREWENFLLKKLILFRASQRYRYKEPWYIDTIKNLMSNKLFCKLWPLAQNTSGYPGIDKYERKTLVNVEDISKRLEFHLFRANVLLDRRFDIDFHIPADLNTQRLFSGEKSVPSPCDYLISETLHS